MRPIRERILDLIIDLARQTNATLLLLTHDLRSVARRCERVAVMYGGRVVEIGATEDRSSPARPTPTRRR